MTKVNPRYVSEKNSAAIATIKRIVAKDYEVKAEDLDNDRRQQPAALARQIAMHFCRRFVTEPVAFRPTARTPMSFPSIAAAFNRNDHGTAMHACSVVANRYAEDRYFAARIDRLASEIGAEMKKEVAA